MLREKSGVKIMICSYFVGHEEAYDEGIAKGSFEGVGRPERPERKRGSDSNLADTSSSESELEIPIHSESDEHEKEDVGDVEGGDSDTTIGKFRIPFNLFHL